MTVHKFSDYAFQTVGSHTKVTTNGAVTLTRPAGATGIIMQATAPALTASAAVRYTLDGSTAAEAAVGFLEAGDTVVRVDFFNDMKLFLEDDALLEYQWFKAA